MQITPEYCRQMARYNRWQNSGLRRLVSQAPPDVLTQDRGAFFGSIRATLDHLLWADRMWLSRLTGSPPPPGGIADSVALTPTPAVWAAERFRTDADLVLWADGLKAVDLVGDLVWYSGAVGRELSRPLQSCVVHLFNHQTHHRGQVHAMLTAAGLRPDVTDFILMPDTDD